MGYLNPHLYLEPFDPERLEIANEYYPSIEANRGDYIALENIPTEAQWFIDEIEKEREEKRKKLEEVSITVDTNVVEKLKREDAIRRFNMDQSFLEDIRNSLGIYHYKKYIQENYGGYIDIDNL